MKKFIHLEDNEDDTTSVTICIDGENEETFLLPMSIMAIMDSMFDNDSMIESTDFIADKIIVIPNQI